LKLWGYQGGDICETRSFEAIHCYDCIQYGKRLWSSVYYERLEHERRLRHVHEFNDLHHFEEHYNFDLIIDHLHLYVLWRESSWNGVMKYTNNSLTKRRIKFLAKLLQRNNNEKPAKGVENESDEMWKQVVLRSKRLVKNCTLSGGDHYLLNEIIKDEFSPEQNRDDDDW
jgi:hypothetical protein